MRSSCLECVLKHLGQAAVNLEEYYLGYPLHKYLAIGHLAEASVESIQKYPKLAHQIRDHRKLFSMNEDYQIPIMDLIKEAAETDEG